ncbi:MAG TPA: DUF4465 domain-containing protein [Prolixibacteraceae bacterium]
MRNSFSLVSVLMCILLFVTSCSKKEHVNVQTIDFESLTIPPAGYWNGSDATGSFSAGDLIFQNSFDSKWQIWSGFIYSQKNDVTTQGSENQYSVFDQKNGSNKFALFHPVYQGEAFAVFPSGTENSIQSIDLCNTTFAALTMKYGDPFSKKFGGTSGNDPDWFRLSVNGYNRSNVKVGSVDIYLADFRFADSSKDYILDKWTTFDLTSLGKVNKISFSFSSSDMGAYGINTPDYVCLDNIKYINDMIIL